MRPTSLFRAMQIYFESKLRTMNNSRTSTPILFRFTCIFRRHYFLIFGNLRVAGSSALSVYAKRYFLLCGAERIKAFGVTCSNINAGIFEFRCSVCRSHVQAGGVKTFWGTGTPMKSSRHCLDVAVVMPDWHTMALKGRAT